MISTVQVHAAVISSTHLITSSPLELFTEEIIDNFALYVLNICEVCGSYQCPYCPYFSGSITVNVSVMLITAIVINLLRHIRPNIY